MKKIFTLLGCLMLTFAMTGQSVTFSEHIAPIIYDNCTSCHRPGEIGPMALTNYEEIRNWAPMIDYVTDIRYMPPWKPDPDFSNFLDERALSDEEIQLIQDWVAAGTPQGDPALEPPLPDFPEGSQLGEPDLVLSFEEAHLHPGDNLDEYRYFVLPTGLTEDVDLSALELRPGNTRIVHHALFWNDTTGQAAALDAETPEYGFEGFGGFGSGQNSSFTRSQQLPGYVPGAKPRHYVEGIGQRLYAGSDLVVQMHYAPTPVAEYDSSTVNLFFKDEPVARYVRTHIMLPVFGTLTNGPFFIPANQERTFHGIWEIEEDLSLIGVAPHMHLLGRDWTVFAISPEGDTTNLISIPDWDFNWQGTYYFDRFVIVPAGSEIHAYASYDNTADNPYNPNNPPQWVSWGEGTADEMYYLPIAYVPYQPGDENVVFPDDQTTDVEEALRLATAENKLYPPYPNPAAGAVTIGYTLETPARVSLEILDATGRSVKTVFVDRQHLAGQHKIELDGGALPSGFYLLNLRGPGFSLTQPLMAR